MPDFKIIRTVFLHSRTYKRGQEKLLSERLTKEERQDQIRKGAIVHDPGPVITHETRPGGWVWIFRDGVKIRSVRKGQLEEALKEL